MSLTVFRPHSVLRLTLLIAFLGLVSCNPQAFPSCCDPVGLRNVPFIETYNFGFQTGSGPILLGNVSGNLTGISSADLQTLLASAQDTQQAGMGILSGTVVYNGQPVSSVGLKVTDQNGNILAIRVPGNPVGNNLVLPDGTLCPPTATHAGNICILGSLYYNSLGGVPDFSNNSGTSDAGTFTVFNLPPGDVYLFSELGGRAAGKITIFADEVSVGKLQVLPTTVPSVSVTGSVVDAGNEATVIPGAKISIVGLQGAVTAAAGATGVFTLDSIGSNGTYLMQVTQSGYLPTYTYLSTPLTQITSPTAQITQTATVFSSSYVSQLISANGGVPLDPTKGILSGRITSPDSTPQPCAVLSVSDLSGNNLLAGSSPAIRFYLGGPPNQGNCDASITSSTGPSGQYFIYNLPPGPVFLRYIAKEPGTAQTPVILSGGAVAEAIPGIVLVANLANSGNGATVSLSGTVSEVSVASSGITAGNAVGNASIFVEGLVPQAPAFNYTTGSPAVPASLPATSGASGAYTIPSNSLPSSDPNGNLPLVGGGAYLIKVSASGHLDTYQTIPLGTSQTTQAGLISVAASSLPPPPQGLGHLMGNAIDQTNNKGAPAMTLQITDLSGNILTTVTTDNLGGFSATNLPAGPVNLHVVSQDDSGNGLFRVYPNGVNWITFIGTKSLPRTVNYAGTLRDLDSSAVNGANLTVPGHSSGSASGTAGTFSLPLETNGQFVVTARQNGYHDSYNDNIQSYLFDRTDTNSFNDLFLPSRNLTSQILGAAPNPTLAMAGGAVVGRDFAVSNCAPCLPSSKGTLGYFNADTILDVALINGTGDGVNVYFGNSNGTFSSGAPSCPPAPSCAVGPGAVDILSADFNGDGNPDLAIADSTGDAITILLGSPNGTFTVLSTDNSGTPTPYFLVDSTGVPADKCGNALVATSPSSCSSPLLSTPVAIVSADFNGDGIPDLAVLTSAGVNILLGVGDGSFRPFTTQSSLTQPTQNTSVPISVGQNPTAIATADINLDGQPDLVVTSAAAPGQVWILLGAPGGSFTVLSSGVDNGSSPVTFPTGQSPAAIAIGDFNGDGRPDVAVINQAKGSLSILMGVTNSLNLLEPLQNLKAGNPILLCALGGPNPNQNAAASTADTCPPVGASPVAITTGEFNGDGRMDLAVLNKGDNSLSILLGNGDGTFTLFRKIPLGTTVGPVASVLIGDINRDGLFDLIATGSSVPVLLGVYNPLAGISVQANDQNGLKQGVVYYYNDQSNTFTPGPSTQSTGRFLIFNLAPGLTNIFSSSGAAGNRLTTVFADSYTEVTLRTTTIAPFTVPVSGQVLDPVGPPPTGVGIGDVLIRFLGTTCSTNSFNSTDFGQVGIYSFLNMQANSEYMVQLQFTPAGNPLPPTSGC